MKKIPIICLLFISAKFLSAQQTAFLRLPTNDSTLFESTLAGSFETYFSYSPESWKSITILIDELKKDTAYDFSKLKNLETVYIVFTLDPKSTDAQKKKYIRELNETSKHLASFSKCPKLKNIVFGIGEQIFLSQKEIKERKKKQGQDDALLNSMMQNQNLENGWKKFGKNIPEILPRVKFYAFNYNW
jgi:hypothetical protein